MTDLDKMARELLAQWHLDRGLGEKVAQDCRDGVIDIPEIYWELIRAALLTAPPGWKLVPELADDAMLSAGFPRNEIIDGCFDRQGAWADMLASAPEVK